MLIFGIAMRKTDILKIDKQTEQNGGIIYAQVGEAVYEKLNYDLDFSYAPKLKF